MLRVKRTLIAECDSKGCLSSVEDGTDSTRREFLASIQLGQMAWKLEGAKLVCHKCLREREEKQREVEGE